MCPGYWSIFQQIGLWSSSVNGGEAMIQIGLTGWGDHKELYKTGLGGTSKLTAYSSHFPIVEVDSSFYAVQPVSNYEKWACETPAHFSFIVKAYQGITGHDRGKNPFTSISSMFQAFTESIEPVRSAGKLKAVLLQFPPWFDCTKENVEYLRVVKGHLAELPAALEFRNQSWFSGEMTEKTLEFMQAEKWIHSICDEPQAGTGSIPAVLQPTDPDLTLVRFHGRNAEGWNSGGQPNWRDVRYLYRYDIEELTEWKEHLLLLEAATKEICVLFNNNSGGDAAANAKQMMRLLGIRYGRETSSQMELF